MPGVFTLAVQPADLRSQIGELIITVRSRVHGADDYQERHQYLRATKSCT
jgi:hypothetical protein